MFICIQCLGIYGNDIVGYICQGPLLQIASYVKVVKVSVHVWHRDSHSQLRLHFSLNKVKHKLNSLFVIHLTRQRESAARRPD